MKIYCASDFHIGYKNSNYTKIKEFFELVIENADELVLCGDVFDLWRCPVELIKNPGTDEKHLQSLKNEKKGSTHNDYLGKP
jgi:UDP-2,3-diacylglucosamine pyrophosphatase LpxH